MLDPRVLEVLDAGLQPLDHERWTMDAGHRAFDALRLMRMTGWQSEPSMLR